MRLIRPTILAAAVAALSMAVALPASAQGGYGPGDGRHGRGGPRGERFARILTETQMEQIRPWLQAEREAAKPLAALRQQLRDLVLSDAPDQGKIAALEAQIAPLEAEALNRRVALAQRIAATLTPEQRKQMRESRFVPPFLDPAGMSHMPPGAGGPPAGARQAPGAKQ